MFPQLHWFLSHSLSALNMSSAACFLFLQVLRINNTLKWEDNQNPNDKNNFHHITLL